MPNFATVCISIQCEIEMKQFYFCSMHYFSIIVSITTVKYWCFTVTYLKNVCRKYLIKTLKYWRICFFQFAITSFTSNARYLFNNNVGELLITQVLTVLMYTYSRSIAHLTHIWYRYFEFQFIFVHLLFITIIFIAYKFSVNHALYDNLIAMANCQYLFRSSLYPTA